MVAKKSAVVKMSANEFLSNGPVGAWADDDEEEIPQSRNNRNPTSGSGYTDRYAREDSYSQHQPVPFPDKPPYTAHIGHLPYIATEADVKDFFANISVTKVRIVEDKGNGKSKGFGYAEFATAEDLTKALAKNNSSFHGRDVSISIAHPAKDSNRGPEVWTKKGPLPDLPNSNNMRRASDRGPWPMERSGSRRGGQPFEGDNKDRDFSSNWQRKGPLSPLPSDSAPRGGGRVRERKSSPNVDTQSHEGSRPPREFRERPPPVERAPTAADQDNQWRARMRPDAPPKAENSTPEASTPPSPKITALTSRPRLNLQKRTVSEASPNPVSAGADVKASPFGGAKPIDTAAHQQRLLETRLKREEEQKKKESEEAKAGSENVATDAPAAAAAPQDAKDAKDAKDTTNTNGNAKAQPAKNFAILSRDPEAAQKKVSDAEKPASEKPVSEDPTSEKGTSVDGGANGTPHSRASNSDDQRTHRRGSNPRHGRGGDVPRGPKGFGGQWRNSRKTSAGQATPPNASNASVSKSPAPAPSTSKTTATSEPAGESSNAEVEEGWSTVQSSSKRGGRRGGRGGP